MYPQQAPQLTAGVAVKAPGFGDNHKSILGDFAILTGGIVFIDEIEHATVDMLSSTGIAITKDDTIVLNGEGSKDTIQFRGEQIVPSLLTRSPPSSTGASCKSALPS